MIYWRGLKGDILTLLFQRSSKSSSDLHCHKKLKYKKRKPILRSKNSRIIRNMQFFSQSILDLGIESEVFK
jgi:hypothetical protein